MKCKVQWKILLAILTLMSGKMSAQRTEAFGQYRKTQDSQIEHLLRQQYQEVSPWFEEAYRDYPTLPRGVLEAVAFQYTRFDPNVRMDTAGRMRGCWRLIVRIRWMRYCGIQERPSRPTPACLPENSGSTAALATLWNSIVVSSRISASCRFRTGRRTVSR